MFTHVYQIIQAVDSSNAKCCPLLELFLVRAQLAYTSTPYPYSHLSAPASTPLPPVHPLDAGPGNIDVRNATKTVAVSVIFGAIGLWAVFCSDARAAKWYLWTWLPRYLVEVATAFVGGWTVLYSYVFSYWLFWFLYYTKASLSVVGLHTQ